MLPEKAYKLILSIPEKEIDKNRIEQKFYQILSNYLINKQFENFEKFLKYSDKLGLYLDIKKVPKRYKIISDLLKECIQEVSAAYQVSSLGKFIKYLKFFNDYGLFERKLNKNDYIEIEQLKKDIILISNLRDLFVHIPDYFLLFLKKKVPQILYDLFLESVSASTTYFAGIDQLFQYIRYSFFNHYSIYGLSVKNLGPVASFIKEFKKHLEKNGVNSNIESGDETFLEFTIEYHYSTSYGTSDVWIEREIKKHLISIANLKQNIDAILSEDDYNFYNLSMVLLGGLGPQGHGFTYSTPKGEVIEICSDRRENQAIIVKYKKFLMMQFVDRFEKQLVNFEVNAESIIKIVQFLQSTFEKNEIIDYNKKDLILKHIKSFLSGKVNERHEINSKYNKLLKMASNAIDIILRPISMIDQFKCRMDLISKGRINSEDIARLTSLKDKSHYDILKERLFFQYVVDWFYNYYLENR